ncbi:MAG: hypothetical protein Q9M14_02005 [Mariprofundaceae bacterium]|nr:hypothetical protein [Mariprofundaceae bacterium]
MAYSKQILKGSLAMAAIVFLLSPTYAASYLKKGSLLRITLSEALLKSSPHPFGSTLIKKIPKGSSVTYLQTSGIYYRVSDGQDIGYVTSKSVVAAKKFKSFSRGGQVTQSDMAAATKGFSSEVEQESRKNKKLRYDLMDKAEKLSAVIDPDTEFREFRKLGKLGEYAHD